jgi:hypothetical protein
VACLICVRPIFRNREVHAVVVRRACVGCCGVLELCAPSLQDVPSGLASHRSIEFGTLAAGTKCVEGCPTQSAVRAFRFHEGTILIDLIGKTCHRLRTLGPFGRNMAIRSAALPLYRCTQWQTTHAQSRHWMVHTRYRAPQAYDVRLRSVAIGPQDGFALPCLWCV